MFDGAAAADVVAKVADTVEATPAASQSPTTGGTERKEVAFVDSAVTDRQQIIDNLGAGVEVVVIDATLDGLTQMAEWAAGHSGYDAVHVFSHGAEATVALGTATLNADSVIDRQAELAALGAALTGDGDILLYGCDVAKDEAGRAFIEAVAQATGADVAASDDTTGAGGDWDLERSSGTVETAIALTDAGKAAYDGDLAFVSETGASGGAVVCDSNGNTYAAITFSSTITIDGTSFTSAAGSNDVLLYKLDGNGHLVWSKLIGSTDSETSTALTLDAAGNLYLCGQYNGSVNFGGTTLTSAGGTDCFVAKYNADGTLQTAFSIGGTGSGEKINGITVDATGNTYVIGDFTGSVDFAPGAAVKSVAAVLNKDIFIAKYGSTGNLSWVNTFNANNGNDSGTDIALDAGGNLYVTGQFNGTGDFNLGTGVTNLTSNGNYDIFLAKYSGQTGALIWAKNMGGTGPENNPSLAIDNAGYIYVTGLFQGTADFDPNSGTATLTPVGSLDIFLAKYSTADGSLVWAKSAGSAGGDAGTDVAVDSAGNVYLAATFQASIDVDFGAGFTVLTKSGGTNAFIAKYTSNGVLSWVDQLSSSGNSSIPKISSGADGSIAFLGLYGANGKTGTFVHTSGTQDLVGGAVVARLNPDGSLSSPNTAPTFASNQTTRTVNENSAAVDLKTLLGVYDTDSGQTLTWSVVTAPTHGTVSAVGAVTASGFTVTSLTADGTLTYTPTAGYVGSDSFTIQVSDGIATITRTIAVTVANVAPVGMVKGYATRENAAAGTVIGTPMVSGDTNGHTYALVDDFGGCFAIDPSTGLITLTGALDYETRSSYTLTVKIQDDGRTGAGDTVTTGVMVVVTDVAEGPSFVLSSPEPLTIQENAHNVSLAKLLPVNDADAGRTLTWTVVSGPSLGTVSGFPATAVSNGGEVTASGITYSPNVDATGTDTIVVQVSDGAGGIATMTINIAVSAISPTLVSGSLGSVAESAAAGTSVGTIPNDCNNGGGYSYEIIAGNVGGVFSIDAATGEVKVAKALDYETRANYLLTVRLTKDSGTSTEATYAVAVTDVAEGPTNAVAAAQTVGEDSALVFSAASGNGLSVSAPTDSTVLTTTLSVGAGKGGLSVTAGSGATVGGDGTGTVTLHGTAAQINAALARVTYTPTANGSGAGYATLTMVSTDGSLSDTDTIAVTVTAAADTPSVTTAATAEDTQSSAGLVITRSSADGAEVGYYRITGITGGTLYKNDGTTVIAEGDFITAAEGAAGLKFTPSAESTATGSFLVQASTSAAVAGLGGDPVKATITVSAVDDRPVLTMSSGSAGYAEDGGAVHVDAALTVADVDGGTIDGARVIISAPVSGDSLGFTAAYGITGSYNATTGVLSLAGNATAAQYQEVLRSVTFSSTSEDASARSITFALGNAEYNPATGHWYKAVTSGSAVSWTAAKASSEASSVMGMTGYLATISSAAEDAFVFALAGGTYWLGGTDSVTEGTWKWISGSESGTQFWQGAAVAGAYSNWNPGEPNNDTGEDYLAVWKNESGKSDRYWNDFSVNNATVKSYIIEYGGQAGDPVAMAATRTIAVTATNDAPVNTIGAASVSVNEEATLTFSSANSNAITVADPDGAAGLSVTLSVNSGVLTLATTSNLTVTGNGTAEVVLSGTAADLNAALNGLRYVGKADFSGTDTLTIVTSDGGNTGTGGPRTDADVITITVNGVNDVPTFSGLGGSAGADVTVKDGGAGTVVLDSDALLADVELDSHTWSGATLTLARSGGANAADIFGATGTLSFNGGSVLLDGTAVGTYTNSGGTLAVTFGTGATASAVDQVLRQITYSYNAQAASQGAIVTIGWTIGDGNSGAQGSGGAKTATGSVKVGLDKVNDAPFIDALPAARTVAEDGVLILGGGFDIRDIDGADTVISESVVLTVGSGTLSLGTTTGLSNLSGTGTGTLTFSGLISDIEAALASLVYRPSTDFNGLDTLSVKVIDPADNNLSASGAVKITVTAVNDAPTFSRLGDTVTPAREQTAVLLDADALLADPELDAAGWSGAVLTLSRQGGADASDVFGATGILAFSGGNVVLGGVTVGTYVNSAGTLAITFNAAATAARVDQVVQQITYMHSGDAPPASVTIAYTLADGNSGAQGSGGALSGGGAVTVALTAVNDAPVNTVSGARTVDEDTGLSLSGLSFADPDGGGGIAEVTLGVRHGTLTLSSLAGVTVSGGANGSASVTIRGQASAINAALAGLSYQGAQDYSGADQLTMTTTDDGGLSDTDTVTITVNPVADAPAVSGLSDVSAAEGGGAVRVLGGMTVADPDSTFSGAVLTVGESVYHSGDVLSLANVLGVTYNSSTGAVVYNGVQVAVATGGNGQALVVTFNASASAEAVNMVARAVTFAAGGDNPTAYGAAPTRTLQVDFSDGALSAVRRSATLTIDAVDDKPVVTAATTTASFTEGGAAVLLLGGVSVSDVDGLNFNGGSVTVRLDAYRDGDRLAVSDGGGITVSGTTVSCNGTVIGSVTGGDGADLVISLTSSDASAAAVQSLLGRIGFVNTGDDPTLKGNAAQRVVTFVVDDGGNTGAAKDSKAQILATVSLGAVNDTPVAAVSSGTLTYVVGTGAAVVDAGLTLSDADDQKLSRADVAIDNPRDGASETLSLSAAAQSAATAAGLSVSYDAATHRLTITGNGDVATYQLVLRGVQYANSAATPDAAQRNVSFVVQDASGDAATRTSAAVTRTLAFNTAPSLVVNTGLTINENAGAVTLTTAMLRATDAETSAAASLVYTLTGVPAGGKLMKDGAILFLNQTFTQAEIDAGRISYQFLGGEGGSDTIGFSVGDGTTTVAGRSFAVTVNAVNDAPIMASATPTLTTITEDQTSPTGTLVSGLLGTIIDPDGGAVSGMAVIGAEGAGTWQYSIDGGTTYTDFGRYDSGNALLLRSTDLVRFVPDGVNGTTGTLRFHAWDRTSGTVGSTVEVVTGASSAFSFNANAAQVTVTAVNDSPVSADVVMAAAQEDVAGSGSTVQSLLAAGFSDVDSGASPGGMVITGNAGTHGQWQYSTDGTHWHDVGTVGEGTALALSASARLRFVAEPDWSGTPGGLTYRAVDDSFTGTWTDGAARSAVNAAVNGGTSALAATARSVTVTVEAVNDAPVVAGITTPAIDDTQTAAPFAGVTIADVDSSSVTAFVFFDATAGTLDDPLEQGMSTGGSFSISGSTADVQAALRRLVFTPTINGYAPSAVVPVSFTLSVVDAEGGAGTASQAVVNVTGINDLPSAGDAIGDVSAVDSVQFTPSPGTFLERDPEQLTYSATLADGSPLPTWLSLDPATGGLTGTIPVGTFDLEITLSARDGVGGTSQTFNLHAVHKEQSSVSAPASAAPAAAEAAQPGSREGRTAESISSPLNTIIRDTTGATKDATTAAFSQTLSASGGVTTVSQPVVVDPAAGTFKVVQATSLAAGGDVLMANAPLRDVGVDPGSSIRVRIPPEAFAHIDAGAQVTLTATREDGTALPGWVVFNPQTGTFEGRPPPGFKGEVVVKVTARDHDGREAAQTFKILVGEAGRGNVVPRGDGQVDGGGRLQQPQNGAADRTGDARQAGKPSLTEQLRSLGMKGQLAKQAALFNAIKTGGRAA